MDPRTDIPDGHRYQTCQNQQCLKTSNELGKIRTCASCKRASYCSRACQRADFKRHKPICSANNATENMVKSLDNKQQNLAESLRKWMPLHRQWQLEVYLHCMGLKRHPQKYRTHGIIVNLDAYATEWNTYVFTFRGASSHPFEDILQTSLLAGQDQQIQHILDGLLNIKQRKGLPVLGGLALYVAKAVDKDDCLIINSSSLIIETSMLEDFPEIEDWVDILNLALRVPSGLYDKNIPIAMYRWVTKHHSYLTYCCIYTLDLNNPLNQHKTQDCVEIDMMVSAPDEKGRYRFTPLATKRTSWEDYHSRRNDYDSTNGEASYAANKEKNKQTIHNGKPGVVCIVMLSLRSEIAMTLPMFFSHDDMNRKELKDWDVNYKFLEKTAF